MNSSIFIPLSSLHSEWSFLLMGIFSVFSMFLFFILLHETSEEIIDISYSFRLSMIYCCMTKIEPN